MKGGSGDKNLVVVIFIMVVFVFAHCHNIYGIAPCGAKHVIETAAYAHISLSAVVQKGSLEL